VDCRADGISDVETYMHAPRKLLYEFAFARQMLEPKQTANEHINTGLLP
jgi:hypothetical protein